MAPGNPAFISVANTATTNQGQVSWANGSNATRSWVSSVTPGSSFTGTDDGSLRITQLFTITSSATAVATVNNKNTNKRVTISWDQSNAASYRVNYTITNAGAANGTFNQNGNSTASSASFIVTLGNVSGTVRANSVTVYSSSGQSGVSSTFTPGSAPQTSPVDTTSSNTGSGSITFTQPVPVNTAVPTISPGSGTAGSTTFSSTTGTWTNSPTSFAYQWRYFDSDIGAYQNLPSANSSSYSPASNYVSLYGSRLICRVVASNAGGDSSPADSSSVTVSAPTVAAPSNTVAPAISPASGTAGSTTYSCTTGSWSNSPTSYAYQWQYNDQGSIFLNITGATSSSYSPPSNFFALGYASPIRCRVTATNSGGSTTASSNQVTVSAQVSVPSGGSVTLSGTGVDGTTLTATTSGWSGSPTSYNVRIYASTSNPPTTSGSLKASSSSSSVDYPVTNFDASPPAYYFKAFATATNAAGTSSEVGSNVILSSLAATTTTTTAAPTTTTTTAAPGDSRCPDPNYPYYYYGNICTASDDANGVGYCGEEGISGICGPGTGPECFFGCGGTCCGGHV